MSNSSNDDVGYIVSTNNEIICRLKHEHYIPDITASTKIVLSDLNNATGSGP